MDVSKPTSTYSVAGYVPGDRIGAGLVVDPATISAKEARDTKLVTVDLNMNGQADAQDDKVLVKLPPKGFIPANWQGPASLGFGGRVEEGGAGLFLGGLVGGFAGAFAGLGAGSAAEAGVLGVKLASDIGSTRVALAVGLATLATGLVVGYKMSTTNIVEDADKARSSAVPDMVAPKYILNQYLLNQK